MTPRPASLGEAKARLLVSGNRGRLHSRSPGVKLGSRRRSPANSASLRSGVPSGTAPARCHQQDGRRSAINRSARARDRRRSCDAHADRCARRRKEWRRSGTSLWVTVHSLTRSAAAVETVQVLAGGFGVTSDELEVGAACRFAGFRVARGDRVVEVVVPSSCGLAPVGMAVGDVRLDRWALADRSSIDADCTAVVSALRS